MERIRKHKKKILILALVSIILAASMPFLLSNVMVSRIKADDVNAALENAVARLAGAGYISGDRMTVQSEDIPVSKKQLIDSGKTEYSIDSMEDWLAFMILSSETDLQGYTFKVDQLPNGGGGTHDLTDCGFIGIAPVEEYPFRGTFCTKFADATIQIVTNVPLFQYLDASAKLGEGTNAINITVRDAGAGLAQVLTGTGTISQSTYQKVSISGTVSNSEGYAGGLFGQMKNSDETALTIGDITVSNSITSISGKYAGGLAGGICGNVVIKLNQSYLCEIPVNAASASGDACAGGLVGELTALDNAKPVIQIDSLLEVKNDITSTDYAGGLAGRMENCVISADTGAGIRQSTALEASGYAGGLAGYMKKVTCTFADFSLMANISKGNYAGALCGYAEDTDITVTQEMVSQDSVIKNSSQTGKQYVGGFIGYYKNGKENASLNNIKVYDVTLSAMGTDDDICLGGIIGYMDAAGADIRQSVVENIFLEGNKSTMKYSCFGGIIGVNGKAGISISDVSVQFLSDRNSKNINNNNKAWYVGKAGGIIGYTPVDCSISNAYDMQVSTWCGVDNAVKNNQNLRTNVLGGIVAVAGDGTQPATVTVENVTYKAVEYNYLSAYEKPSSEGIGDVVIGGVAGKIQKGSVLCMNGDIDLSKIQNMFTDTLAYYKYYGYVVGEQNDALVYLNPKSCSASGYVYGFSLPQSRYADEIGNYGAVYRNGSWDSISYQELAENQIQSDAKNWLIQVQDGSTSISGTLTESGSYSLSSPGDMMRLSIVLNSEGTFGSNCFGNAAVADLLRAEYSLTKDIDIRNTGIISINRNSAEETFAFQGKLNGNSHKITYQTEVYYQANPGLFSIVKNAEFRNLELDGTIHILDRTPNADSILAENITHKDAGGIAARAYGSITVSNVTGKISLVEGADKNCIRGKNWNNREYYGGLFGYYKPSGEESFQIDTATLQVDMENYGTAHCSGGLLGYVDVDSLSTAALASMQLKNITLSGNLALRMDSYEYNDECRVGGVIAVIGNSSDAEKSCEKLVELTAESVTLQDFSITGGTETDMTYIPLSMGGLVGYQWKNTDAEITGLKVSGTADTSSGIIFQQNMSLTSYGGLWNSVYGHMSLKTVNIEKTAFQVNSTQDYNSLLIREGRYLYLELEGYSLSDILVVTNGKYYDEIMGKNKGTAENENADTGGIVSIVSSQEYGLYQNQVTSEQKNPAARYYYNLPKDLAAVEDLSGSTMTVDSVGDLLQWHLAHYANEPLRQYFKAENYQTSGETVTFSGQIDLGDASYYPTDQLHGSYQASNATITFHGASFDSYVLNQNSPNLLYSYHANSEHYMLQSGLFGDVTTSEISGFTLKGTVASYQNGGAMCSGGLIAGSVQGVYLSTDSDGYKTYEDTPTTIRNITLSNLSVSHPVEDGWNSYYGLMVYHIAEGATVQFDQIAMKDYVAASYVAAALIGKVGDSQAQGIHVTFTNMDIADLADSAAASDINSTDAEKVLKYASFIYEYNYFENTATGLYTFYLADYLYGTGIRTGSSSDTKGMVTLGAEIGTAVQFYDQDLATPIAEYTQDSGDENYFAFQAGNYKPYVYQTKKIDVNPKAGNILEGCGTYDSPYVIENVNQFMSLYKYLSDYAAYERSLKGWQINAFGEDKETLGNRTYTVKTYNIGEKKDADNQSTDTQSTYDSLTAGGFPTVEQLNQAYYMIRGDIDLTDYSEFTGFGSSDMPFVGVFIGAARETGQYTITMPKMTAAVKSFGLIQYAKGAVAQNLKIHMGDGNVIVTDGGAAVMAWITGGDNVISNVTVTGSIQASGNSAKIGGYAGEVQMGALILRDMKTDSLQNFSVTNATVLTAGVAGAVVDGFVADDDGTTVHYTNVADLPVSQLKGIVSKTVLEQASIDVVAADGGISCKLDSASDILLVSLALNSGALVYNGSLTSYGYDRMSRCRNADYDYVGSVAEEASQSAYQDVILYDNQKECRKTGNLYGETFYHPYVFRYFSFGSVPVVSGTTADYEQTYCVLNKIDTKVTYYLADGTYDMSVSNLKDCFGGIGAKTYNIWNGYCLQADFKGTGSDKVTILLGINVTKSNESNSYAGLFNRLCSGAAQEISGFKVSGTVSNTASNSVAGGIAAYVNTKYQFTDIVADGLTVSAYHNASAGLVGYNEGSLTFTNCQLLSSRIGSTGGARTGGFVAYSTTDSAVLDFENCSIDTTVITSSGGTAGGFVGTSKGPVKVNVNSDTSTLLHGLEVENNRGSIAGGVAGEILNSGESVIHNMTLKNSRVQVKESNGSSAKTGGVIAYMAGNLTASGITIGSTDQGETVTIGYSGTKDNDWTDRRWNNSGYTGGIIGQHNGGNVTIRDSALLGYDDNGSCTTQLLNAKWTGGFIGGATRNWGDVVILIDTPSLQNVLLQATFNNENNQPFGAAGGVIGIASQSNITVNVGDAKIAGLKIVNILDSAQDTSRTTSMGGIAGYVKCPVTITGFSIDGLNIGSDGYCGECGGVVGIIYQGVLNISASEKYPVNTIKNSIISSGVTGGIFGNTYNSTEKSEISDVTLENVSVVAKYNHGEGWDLYAGGIAGRIESGSKDYKYKNIVIKNSVITGYQCGKKLKNIFVGGVTGGRLKDAKKEYYYNVTLSNVLIGLLENNDTSKDVLPTYQDVVKGGVKLYATVGDGTSQMELTDSVNLVDPQYTARIGVFDGEDLSTSNVYAIRVKVRYDDSLKQYRPAIDVGTTEIYATMSEAYAAYRKRYHIIYSDYENEDGGCFVNLDTVWKEKCYENQTEKDSTQYRMDVSYGQEDISFDDIQNIYESTYKDSQGYLSTFKDASDRVIPMVVVSSWEYDVSAIINTYINILTNNGGATNSAGTIVSVGIDRKSLVEGVIQNSNSSQILSYNDNTKTFSVDTAHYDTYSDDKNATFSQVNVTYKYDNNHTYTISIPIYIKEMLQIDSHMKYMSGAHYSVGEITHAQQCGDISTSVEQQSQFTLYSEFIYSSVRENFSDVTLEKSLYMTDSEGKAASFYKNTMITLIDVTGGGRAYYYTVGSEQVTKIPFTDFQTADDVTYQNKNVGKSSLTNGYPEMDYTDVCGTEHQEVGLEQFLIIIDETEVEEKLNVTHHMYVRALEEDNASMYRNILYEEGCKVILQEIPGLKYLIAGSDEYKKYSDRFTADMFAVKDTFLGEISQISKDSSVNLTGAVYVVSPSTIDSNHPNYWNSTKTAEGDSYLELSISLMDASNKRVNLPDGTKVIFPDGSYYYISDSSYIYYYYSRLGTENGDEGYLNVTELRNDSRMDFSFTLDFSNADLTDVEADSYQIYGELIHTSDFAYPRSGNVVDEIWRGPVEGISQKQLGFALHTDDTLTLGMNEYQNEDNGLIAFETRLDFSDFINPEGEESQEFSKYADKYYTYTFVIQRKEETENAYQYVTYPDAGDSCAIGIYDRRTDIPGESDKAFIRKTIYYTKDELKNLDGHIKKEQFSLYAELTELLKSKKYITNYSITCYVTITDTRPDELDIEEVISKAETEDFFIFTVARLKTDMD